MPTFYSSRTCILPALFATCLWHGAVDAAPKAASSPTTSPASKTPAAPLADKELQTNLATTNRAWAVGVREEAQITSSKLLEEGNTLLKDSLFKAAIDKYREALTHWDHPGVHYNLALAFINLDEPLLVREHLLKAIAFGSAPLDEKKYEYAKNYLKLIDNQLSRLEHRIG